MRPFRAELGDIRKAALAHGLLGSSTIFSFGRMTIVRRPTRAKLKDDNSHRVCGIREINKIAQVLVYENNFVTATFYTKLEISNANMSIRIELKS